MLVSTGTGDMGTDACPLGVGSEFVDWGVGVADSTGGNSTAGSGVETVGEDCDLPQLKHNIVRSVRTVIALMTGRSSGDLFSRTMSYIVVSSGPCYRVGRVTVIRIVHRIYIILLKVFVFMWILHQSIVCRCIWMVWQSGRMAEFVHDNRWKVEPDHFVITPEGCRPIGFHISPEDLDVFSVMLFQVNPCRLF